MDTDRFPRKSGDRAGLGVLLAMLVVCQAVTAAPIFAFGFNSGSVDRRWEPWLDCWELVLESVDHREEIPEEIVLVCLTPDDCPQAQPPDPTHPLRRPRSGIGQDRRPLTGP